jgi:CheY-like chemotaxis protein
MLNSKPVLLVEDDNIDYMTVKRALRDLDSKVPLVRTTNGEEALEYLNNHNNQMPRIILLDLNMPKMNGREFLKVIKVDEKLKHIPVIVFTASKEEYDVIKSFELSVAGFIIKSFDYQEFLGSMEKLHSYWNLSLLPQTT